jgi:hypothetical protein
LLLMFSFAVSCLVLSCLVLSCLVWSSRVVSYTVRLSSLSLRLVDIFGHWRERQRREVSWAASSVPRQRRSLNACGCSTKGAVVCTPLTVAMFAEQALPTHLSQCSCPRARDTPLLSVVEEFGEYHAFLQSVEYSLHATAHRKTQLPTQTKRR